MKKVLLFIACLTMTGVMMAQKVSVDEAKDAVLSYLGEKATRAGQADLKLAYTQMSADGSNAEDVYIFNNGDDGGFVMVAGDMRASSLIIGHSDSGSFDKDNIPSNMSWWLSEYARQIDFMRNNMDEVALTRGMAWGKAGKAVVKVSPLLGSTAWDQFEPYNNMTPTAGASHCPTGCIATAMAQIMYFHKWPKVGKGKHTNVNNAKQSVDFSKSTYQWDKMRDTYQKGYYTEEQGNAVAKLMYDCGASVDMQYDIDGSGGYSTDVPDALTTYFDYSSTLKLIERKHQTDWDDMMVAELEAKRPIYYSGNSDEDGGHAFICDGYEVDGGKYYFHFNWGWGGSGNCYCLSTAMKDTYHGVSFNLNQLMIVGIQANNKVKSGSFYYNVLSDTEAQFTFANSESEYTGAITIPSQVNISGKNYAVTSIGSSAFSGCTGITSVVIPSTITSIGGSAFTGCTALKSITVNWTSDIPEVSLAAFSDEVYNNAALIVPDGMVETYSSSLPWILFATVKDNNGVSVEYTTWGDFEKGRGLYTYSRFYQGTDSLDVIVRSSKDDTNKCMLQFKNWIGDMPLIINLDKSTNHCQVPIQSTGVVLQYQTEEGGEYKTGVLYVADIPTLDDNPDLFDTYPSTYSPVKGRFSLSLVYYVTDGVFGMGTETMQMAGEYIDLGVEIIDVGDLTEKADGSATQKFTLQGTEDVAKFKYATVEGSLTENKVREAAQGIADGTIESKTKSVSLANIVSVTYPKPGQYTFIAIALDASGNYYGDYDYEQITYTSSKEWNDVAKGTYTYSLYYEGEDKDLTLSRNISEPYKWKISNVFNGVDFFFDWDEATDVISFEPQYIGEAHETYGEIYIANNNGYFPEDSEHFGDPSYFDRESDTFKFSVVYCAQAGYFVNTIGVETFKVPGLSTDIFQVKPESAADSQHQAVNLSGQVVGDSYKGIVIKDGKKVLKR